MSSENLNSVRIPPILALVIGLSSPVILGWAGWSSTSTINHSNRIGITETKLERQAEDTRELKEMISLLLKERGIVYIPKAQKDKD